MTAAAARREGTVKGRRSELCRRAARISCAPPPAPHSQVGSVQHGGAQEAVGAILSQGCPTAEAGEAVPSSCDARCAQLFVPLWHKCSGIREVLASVEGGQFAEFEAFAEKCDAVLVQQQGSGH